MKTAETLTVTTPSDREIVMTRVFNAPRRLVFDAHTKPELVKRWLLGPPGWSMPVCEIDLRVGRAARDGVLKSGMEKGVAESYDRLAELLASTT